MTAPACGPEDVALFVDLDRACKSLDLAPCLIGAGAIHMGPALTWEDRPRATRDWDFAIRVDSQRRFDLLVHQLTAASGGFTRVQEKHRLRHSRGGLLDIVPYGGLEDPEGRIRWSDGSRMTTRELHVLDDHHFLKQVEPVTLRIATLPALIGLKLLAYNERRPGITRDIGDVHRILVEETREPDPASFDEATTEALISEAVAWPQVNSYLLGRKVGCVFGATERGIILQLLRDAEGEASPLVTDVSRSDDAKGYPRERILDRMAAFRRGVLDR